MADTGWVLPVECTSVDDVPGYSPYTFPWDNPENAETDDSNLASCWCPEGWGSSSELLVCRFSPSIPSGSSIDGIEVRLRRIASYEGEGDGDHQYDHIIRLASSNTAASQFGENKALGFEDPWDEGDYVDYGGPADTWGATIALSLARQLRVHVAALVMAAAGFVNEADVYYVKLKVHYTPGVGETGTLAGSVGVAA